MSGQSMAPAMCFRILVCLMLFPAMTETGAQVNQSDTAYVGSPLCVSCHETTHSDIVQSWGSSSHHLTMQDPLDERTTITIGRTPGQVVIGRDMRVQPLQDSAAYPAFPPHTAITHPHDPPDAARYCFGCHATGYFAAASRYSEPGIGCEACHGPGSRHAESGGAEGTLAQLPALPPRQQRMICGQCHSLGTARSGVNPFPVMPGGRPFRPGDDLATGFVDAEPVGHTKGGEYSTFIQAPAPYSAQVCTDCHDPHGHPENPSMLRDATSGLCLRCHGNLLADVIQVNEQSHWGADRHTCWFCHEYIHSH